MSKAISRRNFLMATGAVGAAGLLAACGGNSAASSTASSAASQAPAASADESLALSDGPVNLRSEEHTSELQSHLNLVCRLLLEKK
mgnify:CR=1 FL=1